MAQLIKPVVVNKPLPTKLQIRDSTINFIVLHYDAGGSYTTTRRTLINRHLSYHYYIQRDGKIIKMVDPKYKASHVGISYFRGYIRLNSYSIGICLQNDSNQLYTEAQYNSTAWLISNLQKRYTDSTSKIVVGHSDVATPFGRKHDPGPMFNWGILRRKITNYTKDK